MKSNGKISGNPSYSIRCTSGSAVVVRKNEKWTDSSGYSYSDRVRSLSLDALATKLCSKAMRALFLAFFVSIAPVVAMAEPSYDDTVKFIQGKFNPGKKITKQGATGYYVQDTFTEVSKCDFEIATKYHIRGFSGVNRVQVQPFAASKFDPSLVKMQTLDNGGIGFHIYTREEKPFEKFNLGSRDYVQKGGYQKYWPAKGCRGQGTSLPYCERFQHSTFVRVTSSQVIHPANSNVERLAKAFRHLIKVCGGKEELF